MNIVFEQYFQDKAEDAVAVFRSFRKEDLVEDVLDPDHSLVSEAFNDIDTLLSYSESIKAHGNLTMEQCGFIASHINSIERKYKGVVDFNVVVSESQDCSYRSTLVAEAMGKGAMALIAAAIAAVIGIIVWISGKGKQVDKSNADIVSETIKKNQSKIDAWKEEFKQDAKESLEEQKKKADEDYQKAVKALEEAEAAEEDVKKKNLLLEEKEFLKQSKKDYDETFEKEGHQNVFDFELTSRFLSLYLPDGEYKSVEYKDIEAAIDNFKKQNVLVLSLLNELSYCALSGQLDDIKVRGDVLTYENKNIKTSFDSLNKRIKELSDVTPKQHKMVFGLNIEPELIYVNEVLIGNKINTSSNKEPKIGKSTFKINVISRDKCIELNKLCVDFSNSKSLPYNQHSMDDYNNTIDDVKKKTLQLEKRIKDFEKTGKFGPLDEETSKKVVPILKENIKCIYQCIATAENIKKRFNFSLVALTKLVNDLIEKNKSSKIKNVNFYSSARGYIVKLKKNK